MKPFLLFLLFCNVVFLMWEMGPREQQRQAQKTAFEKRLAEAPGLELLKPPAPKVSEPDIKKPADSTPLKQPKPSTNALLAERSMPDESVSSKKPGSVDRCYDYGAFVTWDEAKAFTLQLPDGWVFGKIHAGDVWVDQGFWVMIPAPNTMKAARESLEQVKAKGVTDYWLVPTGLDRGIISLGLFNTMDRAETQRQELQDKGIDAEIDKKRALRSRYRVGIRASVNPVRALQAQGLTLNPALLDQLESCPN